MTEDDFAAFRTAYEARYGKLKDHEFASLIGVGCNTMTRLKQRGVVLHDTVFRLAFSALWHNLDPWENEQ